MFHGRSTLDAPSAFVLTAPCREASNFMVLLPRYENWRQFISFSFTLSLSSSRFDWPDVVLLFSASCEMLVHSFSISNAIFFSSSHFGSVGEKASFSFCNVISSCIGLYFTISSFGTGSVSFLVTLLLSGLCAISVHKACISMAKKIPSTVLVPCLRTVFTTLSVYVGMQLHPGSIRVFIQALVNLLGTPISTLTDYCTDIVCRSLNPYFGAWVATCRPVSPRKLVWKYFVQFSCSSSIGTWVENSVCVEISILMYKGLT